MPTSQDDRDGDGYVELTESRSATGGIVLSLTLDQDGSGGSGSGSGSGGTGSGGTGSGSGGTGSGGTSSGGTSSGGTGSGSGGTGSGSGGTGSGGAGQTGQFPRADADGTIIYNQTFNFQASSQVLQALQDNPEGFLIELHGLTVPQGIGAGTQGEVNGTGGYKSLLPVAAGLIEPIGSDDQAGGTDGSDGSGGSGSGGAGSGGSDSGSGGAGSGSSGSDSNAGDNDDGLTGVLGDHSGDGTFG
ncbi:MAG TPA: hypothetical protein VEB64_05725 [Azospirillaceae bacterium]|nr:hypothetical protein [Azospirillaceae bacterium]